jgi:hypothetical protein
VNDVMKQLHACKSGVGRDPQMSIIASGSLDGDIARLAAWNPSLMVTLDTPHWLQCVILRRFPGERPAKLRRISFLSSTNPVSRRDARKSRSGGERIIEPVFRG